jgi:hypothetical protein
MAFEEKSISAHNFFWELAFNNFIGFKSRCVETPDYWFLYLFGVIELSCYPVLFATNNWGFICVWLGFKTCIQWDNWIKSRYAFYRFFLRNVLVLIVSLLFMTKYIVIV